MSERRIKIWGGIFFAAMFAFACANAYQASRYRASDVGWRAALQNGRIVVDRVTSTGPAALALRRGDEITALDDRRPENIWELNELLGASPGTNYSLTISRDGAPRRLTLRTEEHQPHQQMLFAVLAYALPAIFLMTGLSVFVLKHDDRQALVLALMFGAFGLPLDVMGQAAPWLAPFWVVGKVLNSFFYPLFFHLFLIFPERSPILRRFPKLESRLYLPNLLVVAPYYLVRSALDVAGPEWGAWFDARIPSLVWMAVPLIPIAYMAGGFASLFLNYRTVGARSRRKLRVIVAGCVVGFLPILICVAIAVSDLRARVDRTVLLWMVVASVSAFALFPLSFAYAIVRYQVIPVRVIIRRGVRYVFVSSGSVILETVVMFAALLISLRALFSFSQINNVWAIGAVSAVVGIAAWNLSSYLHHKVVAPAIDRRFFRRAYSAQQIFSELGGALRATADVERAIALASTKMQDALQTENVTIFLRDERTGDYRSAISSEYSAGPKIVPRDLVLPRAGYVAARLREAAQPLEVTGEAEEAAAARSRGAHRADEVRREYDVLREIKSALLVPIATKEQLHGLISLSPRLGDLPFSREDKMLLTSLAWQLAFAVENAQLIERRVEEERLRRELAMATEVQQRLFPERPPQIENLQLAGICYPARGVGGDYYDFLELGGAQIGVAVADVAGKGLSAALLMSIVQASLRSRAAPGVQLTELVCALHRSLYSSSATNSYATFFYAQYDEQTRTLAYVNAGHNPPLLIRNGGAEGEPQPEPALALAAGEARLERFASYGDEAERIVAPSVQALTIGGPVIGLLENPCYEQATVTMRAGDVLFAYTDGVTEALNPAGEEYGEERLQSALLETAHLSADEIKDRVVGRLRVWCEDAPQHDDITLVVMKVL